MCCKSRKCFGAKTWLLGRIDGEITACDIATFFNKTGRKELWNGSKWAEVNHIERVCESEEVVTIDSGWPIFLTPDHAVCFHGTTTFVPCGECIVFRPHTGKMAIYDIVMKDTLSIAVGSLHAAVTITTREEEIGTEICTRN